MKRIEIGSRHLKWTNVATAILKGAAQSKLLREVELWTPVGFPPPQEVVDDVRRANPKLRLVVKAELSEHHMTSHDTTWHHMTSHATSTYSAPHVVCLVSQVVSEWCEVVCWYKCVTVRSWEQLLHWRRDLRIHTCLSLYCVWCIARVTWRPEQALLVPITITCISATTASQNVSCRQCLRELAKNTKHHCRTACQSNPFPTPTQKEWLVYKPLYGACHCQSHRKQCVLCTCSNSRYQAVLPSPHN